MREHIKPHLKDETRIFGQLERELIYHRDQKNCQVPGCEAEVLWAEAEFHHVQEHSKGGPTSLENGALVQKGCHPKSAKEVAKFAEHWEKRTRVVGASAEQQIPSDIASLMKLGNLTYEQAVAMKAQLGKQKD